jgi:hypothetical protein
MADFPSIRTSDWELFKQKKYKRQEITGMESGKVHSRAAHTSSRWIFTTGWNWLTIADYNTLKTFWDTYLGSSFNWTHIWTGSVHVVIFAQDEFPEVETLGSDYVLGPKELILMEP